MLLNDIEISKLAENDIFMPYVGEKTKIVDGKPALSFGLSQSGYDIRLSPKEFVVYASPQSTSTFDVKDAPEGITTGLVQDEKGSFFIIPPHAIGLGVSVERFNMPNDVMGLCWGKSTYARAGLIANITPIEPGWCGYLTMSLTNPTDRYIRVYANEGIAQVVLFRCGEVSKPYEGKYQDQSASVTAAKV